MQKILSERRNTILLVLGPWQSAWESEIQKLLVIDMWEFTAYDGMFILESPFPTKHIKHGYYKCKLRCFLIRF